MGRRDMKQVKFADRTAEMDALLGDGRCFDMTSRLLRIGTRQAKLWVVNGYADDAVLERMIAVWLKVPDWNGMDTLQDFLERYVSIADVTALIDYLLGGDNGACTICADVNGDQGVTIADVTALIDVLLSGN